MKHILSYGGGVNSSALFFHLIETGRALDVVIFADTGEESPATYDAVARMRQECEARGIRFEVVRSEYGRLVDYYREHRAIPSIMRRDCTFKFKVRPIRNWLLKTYGRKEGFRLYIGIAYDEITRMRTSDVAYIENVYPFCDDKIDRAGNLIILRRHGFPAEKSGCQGCIFQKREEWAKLLRDDPMTYARWERMERNGSRYPRITLTGRQSLDSIRRAIREQRDLGSFEEIEPPCAVYGACFL